MTTAKTLYETRLQSIRTLMSEISEGLDEHMIEFETDGERDWGAAGDLGRYEKELKDIADALLERGEYDPENAA